MTILGEARRGGPERVATLGPHRVLVIAAAVLVLLVAGASIYLLLQASRADDVGKVVDTRVSALGITPAAMAPTIDKALRTRRAIVAGDFDTASQIVAEVLGASEVQNWRFYPFADFIGYVSNNAPPEFGDRLDEWVAKSASDPAALLLRAQHRYDAGWAERGRGFASKVSARRMTAFVDHMQAALADVDAALELDATNPFGYYLRLRILQGGGASAEFFDAFADGIAKHPDYYPLYEIALATLQPRWGGSTAAMSAFVDEFAGGAPEFSPLKLLHLSLYRYLLLASGTNCLAYEGEAEANARCIASSMSEVAGGDIEKNVLIALGLYDHTERYQFGLIIKPMISEMLAIPGGEAYAGAVLQLAATSMHGDTQLKPANPGHNHYIVDELVAESWKRKRFPDNATAKYEEALAAVANWTFPSEEDRSLALGALYVTLSDDAAYDERYLDQIVFAKAAALVGVPSNIDRICHGYYQLAAYDRAIEACTEAIESLDNPDALYWRGIAYDKAGQQDAALADLGQVAGSEGGFASSAVIDMSMIYFGRDDKQGALEVLNAYPFVYDPDRTRESTVAVAYNNRCYAYMELGELEKALEDCTQSLRYGSMPDAFRKQQELVARLNAAK